MFEIVSRVKELALLIGCAVLLHIHPCEAQSARDGEPAEQSFRTAGIGQYVRNQWGVVGVDLKNPTPQPMDLLSILYFPDKPDLQFARQFRVPPRSVRAAWFPFRTTGSIADRAQGMDVKTMLIDRTGPSEAIVKTSLGEMLGNEPLSVQTDRMVTGLVSDQNEIDPAVIAFRISQNVTRRLAVIDTAYPPPIEEGLEGLDQLVFSSDSLARDSASLAAIREWVEKGGRLWIMLDKISAETVLLLFGDTFEFREVDRIRLMQFAIRGQGPDGMPVDLEDPVDFVRVIAPGVDVVHTVNNWPASFFLTLGKGKVLFTSLAGKAWVRPRRPGDLRPGDGYIGNESVSTSVLEELFYKFVKDPSPPALRPADFEDFVSEQIGYRIIGRKSVMLVLGMFCLALLGAAVTLSRSKQLEQLGWLGPAAAIVAALFLAMMGRSSRHAVPTTVAVAQMVEVSAKSNDLQMSGMLALYNPEETTTPLGSEKGGIFTPDLEDQAGSIRRMVWTDVDQWHWENVTLPPGLQVAPFSHTTTIDRQISARGTFGPNGLEGKIDAGPFEDLGDALVAFPGGNGLAIRLKPNGDFSAGPKDVLASGEFIGGSILSDEERRRNAAYQKLFRVSKQGSYPAEPKLLAWAAPFDMHFTLPVVAQRVGSALLSIPLEFEPMAPGTRFLIPGPCVQYHSVGKSGAYATEGRWIEALTEPRPTTLRFTLPQEILPVRLDVALLTLEISAPSRVLEITNGANASEGSHAEPKVLATRDSPLGRFEFKIDQADVLKLDESGSLVLGINVTAPAGAEKTRTDSGLLWRITGLQLEVRGEALAP